MNGTQEKPKTLKEGLSFCIRQDTKSRSDDAMFEPFVVHFDKGSTMRAHEYCNALAYRTGKDIKCTELSNDRTFIVTYSEVLAIVKELELAEDRLGKLREFRLMDIECGILNF